MGARRRKIAYDYHRASRSERGNVQRAVVETLIRRAVRAPWDPATVVALGMTLLVLAMWLLKADAPRAHASAERVDTRAVDAPLAFVRDRWEAEVARLRDEVRRLAVHDATYEFARRPNFPYVDDHFGPEKLRALAVDTVLIVDDKGRPIFWRRPNDPDNQGFADAELFLAQLPKLRPARERAERGQPVFEGIVQFRGVPALVTAMAIEPPGEGTPRGHLIYGRAIDGAVSRRVMDGAPAGLDVMPAGDALLPAEVRIRLDRSLTPLIVTDEQRIRGYLPIVDVQGRLLRVYAASAAKPAPVVATNAARAERSSWPIVIGATLLLLLVGGAGLWWTYARTRVARPAPRSDVERLARVLAAETRRGTAPPGEHAAPGLPQVAVAEALVGLGATADEPPTPDWLHARREAPRDDATLVPAHAPSSSHGENVAGEPARGDAMLAPAHAALHGDDAAQQAVRDAAADDHEWLIGTPDEVLLGDRDDAVSDALDGHAPRAARDHAEAQGEAQAQDPDEAEPQARAEEQAESYAAMEPEPEPKPAVDADADVDVDVDDDDDFDVEAVRVKVEPAAAEVLASDATPDGIDSVDGIGDVAIEADGTAAATEPAAEATSDAATAAGDAYADVDADQGRGRNGNVYDEGSVHEIAAARSHADDHGSSDTATFEVRFEEDSSAAARETATPAARTPIAEEIASPPAAYAAAPEPPAALDASPEPVAALAAAHRALAAPLATAVASATSRDDVQAALVRRLLEQGRLRIHYQPQVSTANGTIVGVEALVRWEDDETALRAAGELFGDGTSADSFSGATDFVLRRACADRRQWMRQIGRTLPVGVNVGLAELREPGFVPRVLRILEEADLPPAYLELEVPERALAVPDSPETAALEHAYRSGIGIAIGGFVAADAPLRALTRVPVAKLKLHRSLVADLPDDVHARMVVDAVLAIGRTLNVLVCAEGVERPAQAAYLELRQCPVVQGWHYARPMDADNFFALLKGSGVDTVRMPLMDVEELEAHARAAGVV
jgi:EAL domain-containing protein (putative c-di-GMP-specific phosphodiesterase class I)/sensor domain CHASE-containing protein